MVPQISSSYSSSSSSVDVPSLRSSSRIKKIVETKKRLCPVVVEEEEEEEEEKPIKRIKKNNKTTADTSPASTANGTTSDDDVANGLVPLEQHDGVAIVRPLGENAKVIETIRTFYKHYLHFVQEEEKRVNIREAERKVAKVIKVAEVCKAKKKGSAQEQKITRRSKKSDLKASTKKESCQEQKIKRGSKRPDLKAVSKMKASKASINTKKRIGSVPGIDVGHQFYSRAEMVVVGMHSHWLSGIDYIGKSAKGSKGYTLPLANAIVLSGQYEDDLDNCEDIIYTGSGGNDLLGNKRQIANQEMTRGNLALKNCIGQGTVVRVIRGHQSRTSYVKKIYTYDGLYKVDSYWAEKGVSMFTVFKFRLKRVDGQALLTTNQVYFTNGRVPNSVSEVRGLVCEDISGGLEAKPIPATNLVDEPAVPPTDYTYHKTMIVAENVKPPKVASSGCGCTGSCTDAKKCACARLNGFNFPYVQLDGGRLIEPKAVVFECGPKCGCGPNCVNRTSQREIKYQLEVFRTPQKGWGVRSWDFIPAGAPICEYIGNLIRTEDAESENFYIIDCDTLETMNGLGGRQTRFKDVALPAHMRINEKNRTESDVPEFCVDASTKGNVARYINHSCQPNLFIQSILSDHHDLSQARIVLFASDNIPPMTEFTYDYAYVIDSVLDLEGKPKNVPCHCGADDCRKRLL